MATKDSCTNTALQSSVAFLQIQKNANLKRSTSMNEDVFRIFRQTGRRIALIKQQVERERCTYLKDSYTEKNQVYKELAGIFYSKKATKNQPGADVLSAPPLPEINSRFCKATGKANEGGHCSSLKSHKELPSINVNVLKRCECCRRRAFQKVEDDDDDDNDVFDEEAFQSAESQPPDEKSNEKAKTKVARKTSQASKSSTESGKGKKRDSPGKKKTKIVQFSRYDDLRMPAATQRVQAGIWALKKQNARPADQSKQTSKSVRFEANNSGKSSPRELKTASETPGLNAATRPTLRSRASVKLESQNNKNEKVHLDGNAWTSHLQNVQEKKTNSNNAISGLSKAYCAFKKLLNKMEEEYQAENAQEEELRCESRGEVPDGSRPVSNMSRRDSRWLPLRRSSDTLSIRLNSWTMGGVEPASMGSFSENCEEEQEDKRESGLDTGQGENDRDSLHEVYILGQNSPPDALSL